MNDKKKNILIGVLIVGIVSMTIAYAALSQTLNINGSAKVAAGNWNIHFVRISNTANEVVTHEYAEVDDSIALSVNNTTATLPEVTLKAPGDSVDYYFNVVNEGEITGYVNVINDIQMGNATFSNNESLSSNEKTALTNAISATLLRKSGSSWVALNVNDSIAQNEVIELKVTITFAQSATKLPSSEVSFSNITASVVFGQDTTSQQGGGGNTPVTALSTGDAVYYDPVSNTSCSEATFNSNKSTLVSTTYNLVNDVDDKGNASNWRWETTNTGSTTCYKWRVISNNGSNVTIQMDHNLVNRVQWMAMFDYSNSSNYGGGKTDEGPITLLGALAASTANWDDSLLLNYSYDTSAAINNYGTLSCVNGACTVKGKTINGIHARVITGEEVASLTRGAGADSSTPGYNWTLASTPDKFFYFSNSEYVLGTTNTKSDNNDGDTSLSWLVENTIATPESGATQNSYAKSNNGEDISVGYLTLSPVSVIPSNIWYINYGGQFHYNINTGGDGMGIRPVITIPTSVL